MRRLDALCKLAAHGEDIVPLLDASDAYLFAYTEARFDEWNPDQPRDEHGMWASEGGGTVEGAVKSGEKAIDKAENAADLEKIASSLDKSKVITGKQAGKLYAKLSDAAFESDEEELSSKYEKKAKELGYLKGAPTGDSHTIELPDGSDPEAFDKGIADQFGPGAVAETQDGDVVVVTMPDGSMYKGELPGDAEPGAAVAFEKFSEADTKSVDFGHFEPEKGGKEFDSDAAIIAAFGQDSSWEQDGVGGVLVTQKDGTQWLAEDKGEGVHDFKKVSDTPVTNQVLNPDQAVYAKAKAALKAIGISDPTPKEIATKAATYKQTPAPQPAVAASKSDHAKAARESAKKIVAHAKALRAEYKKNPTPELKAKLEAAEKVAKAARSAARKAEKATTHEEAAKHASKAHAHASKLLGGEEEAKAYVVSHPKATSQKIEKPISPAANKELFSKAEKLLAEAEKPHPSSWSAEKIAAKEAAKKAIAEHSGAKTPAELKAAAAAFDKVASQASAAGSLWGHAYSSLADDYREAATPKETFAAGGKTAPGDHSTPPGKSARPIDSIKGEVVSEKTHDKHRKEYTATLSGAEKKAALRYSGSSYSEINSNLRKDGKPTEHDLHLDKAIAKSPAPRDMVVHRGLSGSFSHNLFSSMKPGDQYVEKAYSSTSAGGSAAFGGNVELHITVPKGYPIAPIPTHHPNEREYLLRRNTKFQVTKIEKVGSTVRAHVTVIHDQKED